VIMAAYGTEIRKRILDYNEDDYGIFLGFTRDMEIIGENRSVP
jgi:hypothetical protein